MKNEMEKHTPNFADWAKQIHRVYGDAGMVMIVYTIASVFNDHIFKAIDSFPLVMIKGPAASGKTSMMHSVLSIFNTNVTKLVVPFPNLKIFYRMANWSKILLVEDYIENESTKDALRKAYNRAPSYIKGERNHFFISSVVVINNSKKEDETLNSRAININMDARTFSNEDKFEFNLLREMAAEGDWVMDDILSYKRYFFNEFDKEEFIKTKDKWFNNVSNVNEKNKNNIAMLMCVFEIMNNVLDFPFEQKELIDGLMQ